MKNILIAGATGHLGPFLVKELIDQGKNVYALIRPESMSNPEKINPLKAQGAHLVEGDINDQASLDKACQNMDVVISALGGGQLMQQTNLLDAALKAGVKRFIPSEFGVDPHVSGPGVCDLFDAKTAIQNMIKQSGIDYTMIYTNGFMEFWGSGLGQLGNNPSGGEVQIFGDGNVKASMVSLPDIARFTAAIIDDPGMANKEVRITANEMTQEELIQTWENLSGAAIKRNPVAAGDLQQVIDNSTAPEAMMTRIFTQLHKSVWINGDTVHPRAETVEATQAYPHIPVMSTEDFFKGMMNTRS